MEVRRPLHSAPYLLRQPSVDSLQSTHLELGNRASTYGISRDAPADVSAFAAMGGDPDRWRGARRGAKIGAVVGALAGVVGFAAILHSTDQAVEENRTPCIPEDACRIQAGPDVGRLFLPIGYLIFAGLGAAGGALVGAGVGAAVGR